LRIALRFVLPEPRAALAAAATAGTNATLLITQSMMSSDTRFALFGIML
jgi:hypothetical protein